MDPMPSSSWTDERGEIIRAQERALAAARRDEHERATALLTEAVTSFREAGIAPIPLRARTGPGEATVRTGLLGWYLTADRRIAVDAEARFYLLRVPGGLRSRLLGADPEPTHAPLVVGRGARDGETVDLRELLATRLRQPVRP